MKKFNRALSKILIIMMFLANINVAVSGAVYAQKQQKEQKVSYKEQKARHKERIKTEIIVKYKNEKNEDKVLKRINDKKQFLVFDKYKEIKREKMFKRSKIDIFKAENEDDLDSIIEELNNDPDVEYAQPNYKLEPFSIPSDARFNEQWGLLNNGQEIENETGRSGVDINATPAWDITTGTSDTVIGLLDTGIDITHEDLADNIYVNTDEIPDNGIDDDGNGYIDDVNGWDFANVDETVFDSSEDDYHGTHMAGIIAAMQNSVGISGAAPDVKVLPLKFINGSSGGYTCDAIEAIEYAMEMGVKVINCSFGGSDDNPALKDAMENSGILFVAAAGNRGGELSQYPVYPAYFDIDNILSVASIDNNGVIDPWSGFGQDVDVAAPGVSIISTTPENTYDYLSGTSTSAVLVTGAAALVQSSLPNLSYNQIAQRIKNNVKPCLALEEKVGTGGRVDVYAALTNTPPISDNYLPDEEEDPVIPSDEYPDDSWYTEEQYAKIKEQMHYGESGVNPGSGNYSFTVNDMTMSAPGFQINISRTYNSKDTTSGILGKGFTFGFEGYAYGTSPVTIYLPNGSVSTFRKNSDGTYTAEDSRSSLIKNADGTLTMTTKDQYTYGFNTDGYLYWMKDKNGNAVNIDVDSNGKINEIIDQTGRSFIITYNSGGLISKITGPEGRYVTYTYSLGKLTKVTDPMGNTMNYEYDTSGFITKIKDHNSTEIISITYDHSSGENQDKVSQVIDSLGSINKYTYDTTARKTTITENDERIWVYWFDTSMYTVKVQDPEGRFETTEYHLYGGKNKYGDIKSQTDRNGNKTQYEIDSNGNVTKIINPDLSFKEFAYDNKNNLIKEIDEEGKVTFYIYDSNKINLVKEVKPLNGTDIYEEGISNTENFAITSYTYYTEGENGYTALGLLKTVTDFEGNTTTYTYDAYGNIAAIKDPENNVEAYEYNIRGWKTAKTSPEQYRTEYTYDDNGLLEKIVQDGGETTRITYDAMGRKTKEVSPNLYDSAFDNIPSHTYTGDHGTRYEYYSNGKLHTKTDAEGNATTYEYDVYGNISKETKPNGAVYEYEYDILDRMTKVYFRENAQAQQALLEEYSYAILADGKKQETYTKYLNETETSQTVSVYDYAGRLVEKQNPDGTKILKSYYDNGLLKTYTDRNASITYKNYDGLNRLSEQWEPFEITENGNTVYTYTKKEYDKAGKKLIEKTGKEKVLLNEVPSTFVATSYTYYSNGKVETVTDNASRQTAYWYDADGNTIKTEEKINETEYKTTEYEYNHLNKPAEKRTYAANKDIYPNSINATGTTALTTSYTYDNNGNLKTITNPKGITTAYTYDNLNREMQRSQPGIDENEQAVEITTSKTYDWEGNILTSTDPEGNITQYQYNERGFLTKVIDTDNGTTAYYYDLGGRKTAEVTPENYDNTKELEEMSRTLYSYDKMDRVKTKTQEYIDPVTQELISYVSKAYEYDNKGNISKEFDESGYIQGYYTKYTYNLSGDVVTVTDPVSQERGLPFTTKYEYDALGRKISQINAKGVETIYTYDNAGNILTTAVKKTQNSPEQLIQENTYDLLGRNITKTDGNGNTTTIEYNMFDSIRKTITPGDDTISSNTVIFQYDVLGNAKLSQNSLGKQNIFTYDNQGNIMTKTERKTDGTQAITLTYSYDKNGNKRFETDGNGTATEYSYDELNRLIAISKAGKTTTYEYDKNGNQTSTTDWRGNVTTNIYDPINRLIETKDADNKTVEKLEYANNLQVKSIDALGNETVYEYDKNSRLVKTTDPHGHETSQGYDDAGNIETKTDGNNISTSYYYDEINRLKKVVNPKGETTLYTYDLNGNMLTQTDGEGNTTTYEYNAADKPVKRIDDGGGIEKTESYTYYADGNLQTKTDRNGNTTNYTYDIHGRITSKTIGEEEITYTYDNNSNQLTITDEIGTTTRTYDDFNRVITKTVPNIGQSTYEYDIITGVSQGYTSQTSTDPKGNTTKKVYDKVGRLAQVTADGETTAYTYYDNGNRESVIYPNGSREEYTYYDNNQLWTLTNKNSDSSTIDTYSYTYDNANNQISKTDSKGTTTYEYDSLNRLETVTEPGGKITAYTYDKAGNRVNESVTNGVETVNTSYTYNEQNRLEKTTTHTDTSTQTTKYEYDDNGNMVSKSTSVTKIQEETDGTEDFEIYKAGETTTNTDVAFYEYNLWNQMSKSIESDKTILYEYNGEGYRVEKSVNEEITRYLYEYDKVVLEVDGAGLQKAKNIYGTNLIAREAEEETAYYMYNGHSDVTALIDATGNILSTYYYDAFGNLTEETGEEDNPYRYAGYRYDEETDLYYLNARYYDSKTARFTTEDTFRGFTDNPLSLNLYTYGYNNPIRYYDPTGHIVTEWDKQNLSNLDRKKIRDATDRYNKAKNDYDSGKISKEEMERRQEAAHNTAESARDNERTKYEVGSDDGYTYNRSTGNRIRKRKNSNDVNSDNYIYYDGPDARNIYGYNSSTINYSNYYASSENSYKYITLTINNENYFNNEYFEKLEKQLSPWNLFNEPVPYFERIFNKIRYDVETYANDLNELRESHKERFDTLFNAIDCLVSKIGVDEDIHYFRNVLNEFSGAPDRLDEMIKLAQEGEWVLLSADDSRLHMYGFDGQKNLKFVSREGRFEAVYNSNNQLVTNDGGMGSVNMGTYNYSAPFGVRKIGHLIWDIIPWVDWGNISNEPEKGESKYGYEDMEEYHNYYEDIINNNKEIIYIKKGNNGHE